jgi:hypothetical protein
MPVAKIHVLEGQYNEARLGKVSSAIQNGLISALGIPPEDFFGAKALRDSWREHLVRPGLGSTCPHLGQGSKGYLR